VDKLIFVLLLKGIIGNNYFQINTRKLK